MADGRWQMEAAYFWMQDRDRRRLIAGLFLLAVAVVYTALLPAYTDSVVMALIHLPILFWAFLGFVFAGASWRDLEARIRFVRYNGDLLILGSLVGLGVFVFSGITVALFEMVFADVAERYFENVGMVLAAAAPVTARCAMWNMHPLSRAQDLAACPARRAVGFARASSTPILNPFPPPAAADRLSRYGRRQAGRMPGGAHPHSPTRDP